MDFFRADFAGRQFGICRPSFAQSPPGDRHAKVCAKIPFKKIAFKKIRLAQESVRGSFFLFARRPLE
ncbi:MAG: hypothetical protein DBX55_01785 [Verrucomicrobia bacterium]|nr:MAG: hypothetical protein DBX55_01785 [Verrucomicrobiota bacterium]